MRASSSQRPNKSRPPTTQFRSSPYDPYLLSSAVYNTGSSSSVATTPPVPSLPRSDHRRGESETEHVPAFIPKTTRGYDSEAARSSQYQIWNPPSSSVKGRPSSRSRGAYESESASVSRTPADAPDRRSRSARAMPRMRESSPVVDESILQPRGVSPLPAKAVETSVPTSTPTTYVSSSRRPSDFPRRKAIDDQPKAAPEQLVVSTAPPLPRLEKTSSSSSTELLSDTSRKASETPPSSARPSPSDPASFRKASVDGLFDVARPISELHSVLEVNDSPRLDRAPKERSYPASPPPAPLRMPMTLIPDKTSVFNPDDGSEIPSMVPQEKPILAITEGESQVKKPPKKEKKRKVLAITQGPVDDQDSQTAEPTVVQRPKWPVWLRLPQSPFSQADTFSTPDMGASNLPNDDDVVVYSVASPLPPSPPHRAPNQSAKASPRVRRRSNSGARQPRRKNSGDDRDSVSQASLPPPSPELRVSQQAVNLAKSAPIGEDKPGPVVEVKPAVPMAEVKPPTPVVEVKPASPVVEVKPAVPMAEQTSAPLVVEEKPEKPAVTAEERPVRTHGEKHVRATEAKAARSAGEVGKSASKFKTRDPEPSPILREAEPPSAAKEIEPAPVLRRPETHFIARTSPLSTRRVSIKAEEMATSYFDLRSPSMEKLPLHDPITLAPALPALPPFIAPEPIPTPHTAAKLADIVAVSPVPLERTPTPPTDDRRVASPTADSQSSPTSPAKESAEHRAASSTSTAPSAHRPFLPDYTRHIRKRSSSTTSQIKVVDDRAATPNDVPSDVVPSATTSRPVNSAIPTPPTPRPEDNVLPIVAPAQLTTDVPSRRLSLHPHRSSRTPVVHAPLEPVPVMDSKPPILPTEDPKETHDHLRRIAAAQSSVAPTTEVIPASNSVNIPKAPEVPQEVEAPQRIASRPLSRAPVSSRPRRSDRSHRVIEPESNEEVKMVQADDIPSRPRAVVLDSSLEHYGTPIEVPGNNDAVQAGDDIPSSLPYVVEAPSNQPSKQGRFPIVDIDAMTPRLDALHSIRDRHVRRPSLQVDKIPEVRSISPLELEDAKPAEPPREEPQTSVQSSNTISSSTQRQEPTLARTSPVDLHLASAQPERSHKLSNTSKPPTAVPPPSLRRTLPDKLPTLAKSNNPIWSESRPAHLRNTSEPVDSGAIQLSTPLIAAVPLAQLEKNVDAAAPMRPSFTQSRSAPEVVGSVLAPNEFDIGSPVLPVQPSLQAAPEEFDWPGRVRSRSNARDTSNVQPSSVATAAPPLRSSPTPSTSRPVTGSPVPAARSSALPLSRRVQAQAAPEPAPVEPQQEDPPPRRAEVKPIVPAPPVPDPMQKPLRSALRNTSSHQSNRRHQIVNEPSFDSTPPPPPVPKLPPVVAPPPKAPSPIPPPLHHRPSTPASSSSDVVDNVAPTKAKKGGLFRQFWKNESKPPTIQPSQEKNDSSSILSRTTSKQKDPVPILSSSTQRSSPVPASSGQSVKYSTPIPRSGGSNSSMPSAAAPSSILRKPPPKDKGLLSSVNNLFGAKRQHRTVSSASLEAVLGASNNNPTSPAPSQMEIPPLPTRDMYDAVARWQKDEERTQMAAVREGKRRPRPGVTWNDLNSEPGSPTR